jgi:hypothetical protein
LGLKDQQIGWFGIVINVTENSTTKYTTIQLILSDRLVTGLRISGTPKLIISLQFHDSSEGQFNETNETTATEEAKNRATHLFNN